MNEFYIQNFNKKGYILLLPIVLIGMIIPLFLISGVHYRGLLASQSDVNNNKLTAYSIAWNKYADLIATNYTDLQSEPKHLSDDDDLDISVEIVGDVHKDSNVTARIEVFDRKTGERQYLLSEVISGKNTSYETSLNENGTFKTPNGLIYKWGIVDNVTYIGGNKYTVKFDEKFPHKCLNVIQIPVINTINYGRYNTSVDLYSYDNSQITFVISTFGFAPNGKIMWRAIGY